jgi:endogenous inhibitor of DNA gyrase (YacG/DUF329 family)
MIRCPICKKSIDDADRTPAFPFCSDRCKLIDLGRWLSDAYQIPAESDDEASDGDPPRPDSRSRGA